MAKSQIRDFTSGNITRQLLVFAAPLFLSNLLQVVYNMVDMVVVGQALGKTGLSAVTIGGDITQFFTFIAMGFSNAGQVLIAQLIGAKRTGEVGRFVGTMASFLIVVALVFSAGALLCQDLLLRLMNTPAESYAGAVSYSAISLVGLVFVYCYNMLSAILRGMGDSTHPFIFISIAAVMNLVLDLLFVLVFEMGPGGAALATIISQAFSCICCTIFLARNREQFALNIGIRDFFRWDREMLGSLVKLGLPMAIKNASIQFSKLFVNSWINSYGVAVSAFAGISSKVSQTCNLFSSALNTAGATMIGQNIAAEKPERVSGIIGRVAVAAFSVSIVLSAAMLLFSEQIIGLFTGDPAVLAITAGYVPISIVLFFSTAARSPMNALINGSGHYKINFVTAIMDGVVMRIGLSVLFGLVIGMEHYGFWLGDALAGFTPFFVGLFFYRSGHWKKGALTKKSGS